MIRKGLHGLKMKIIFLHGAPAVGKLTVARELAKLTGFRLFHNHLTVDLVTSLFPFGSEPFVILREHIWLSAFKEAALHDVSLIFTFNPERTVRDGFIQETLQVVESAGGKVIFVELVCSPDELERRIQAPSRSKFGKLDSIEQYRILKEAGAFSFPSLPRGLSVDTTDSSPADTAAKIRDHVSNLEGQTPPQ
jgi:chloramphenicol 3-O-phosphotransferase